MALKGVFHMRRGSLNAPQFQIVGLFAGAAPMHMSVGLTGPSARRVHSLGDHMRAAAHVEQGGEWQRNEVHGIKAGRPIAVPLVYLWRPGESRVRGRLSVGRHR